MQLIPLHLCVLLDEARQKILQTLSIQSWDDLHPMSRYDISARVVQQLKGERHAPSADTVIFICSYNNVRRDGNEAAHTATQDQVKQAVMLKSVGGMERTALSRCLSLPMTLICMSHLANDTSSRIQEDRRPAAPNSRESSNSLRICDFVSYSPSFISCATLICDSARHFTTQHLAYLFTRIKGTSGLYTPYSDLGVWVLYRSGRYTAENIIK